MTSSMRSIYNHLVVSLFILLPSSVLSSSDQTDSMFKVATGFKLSQGTQLINILTESMSAIYCSIQCTSECNSATYSVKYSSCTTFVEKFYNSSILWSQDPDWVVLYRDEERVQYEDWTMVFRGQKEVKTSLYDAWTATGQNNDSPLSSGVLNGCYRLDNLGGCKQHFRSSILDDWRYVKEIKFSVYVSGSEVNNIVFNGTSTSRDSWFNQSYIMTSSWASIKTDGSVENFELFGLSAINQGNKRMFNICGSYGGCENDKAYFLAIDTAYDICASKWSVDVMKFPVFIYSTFGSMTTLSHKQYLFADVISVFVKF